MSTNFDPDTFDPHGRDFLANPYPFYAQFRAQAPAHRVSSTVATPAGIVKLYDSTWIFRYADVKAILDGTDLFLKNKNPPAVPPAPFDVLQNMPDGLFSLDPPRHDVLRPILDALIEEAIGGIEAAAAAIAGPLLGAAKTTGRLELVSAYAMPLPSHVLKTVLGVSDGDWAGVERWVGGVVAGHDYTAPLASRAMAGTCSMAIGAFFQALTRPNCPMRPEKGRMIDLMVGKGEAQGMLHDEVQMTLLNLAVAGYLSSAFLLATGTLNLLNNPAQLALLQSRPELMSNAIEEMLRFDAPAQLVDRFVARDTELAGVALKAGEQVTAVLGSANHDPDAFADPDHFDITRATAGHVGFGDGIHYCLGATLVRQVAPVAFRLLLSEMPSLKLDGLPQWQTDPYLRSVANLPVAIN
ncbi:MAG: cytochrome P450 [Burkholderiaceae bacterium]|jgi:cytochrome P450